MIPRSLLLASASCFLLISRLAAVTATSLASFEGMEQPAQRYIVATKSFEPEVVQAITDAGGGAFRMALRYNQAWWDGDRDTGNRDRGRAEVKGLGPHQKIGETFEYATTWRIDENFHGTNRFCHLFQLKATEGDDGAPLITMSLGRDPHRAEVHYWSGTDKSHPARSFAIEPGKWLSIRIRVKTAFDATGLVMVSINGDPFQGVQNLPVYRTGAKDYRPKWGLYRGLTAGMDLGDDYVEHRAVSAQKIGGELVENGPLEREARQRAAVSVSGAMAWLESQPASTARGEALGAVAVVWSEENPTAAMDWAFAPTCPAPRAQTLLRIYDRWQVRDQAAALAWLTAHAPDPDLDQVVWYQASDTSFRHGLSGERLTRIASLIVDPALREQAYAAALPRWAKEPNGKAAALAFIQKEAQASESARASLAAQATKATPGGE